MRGTWCRKCIEGSGRRILDRIESIDDITAAREVGKWVESLITVAEVQSSCLHLNLLTFFQIEYTLLSDLSPMANPQALASAYATLLNPLLTLFSTTLTSLIAVIKRSLHKYTFLALASYERLLQMQARFDNVLSLRSSGSSKESNEYKETLTALRGVCLRSFPEFLADIKMAALGRNGPGEINTSLADFTIAVSCIARFFANAHALNRLYATWNGCLRYRPQLEPL
jgi:exocyst complex component 7